MTNVSKSFHYVVTFKVGLSPSKQSSCYLVQRKPFKIDKKCFLFHLKSSFRSRDIYIFVLTFWSCRKKGLIRKIRLILKFTRHKLVNKELHPHTLSNIHTAQYLTKQRQPGIEIWSSQRI